MAEIPNPSVEGPKIMIGCVIIGAVTGSIFLIVLLFVAGDISQVINSGAGPLLQILKDGTSNNAGAICLLMYVAIQIGFGLILMNPDSLLFVCSSRQPLSWRRVVACLMRLLGILLD